MQSEIIGHRKLFAVNIVLLAALFAGFIAIVVYLLKKFEHQAYHDKLTGLANRKYFVEEFKKLKEKADFSGNNIGIIFIDIDEFKEINDNYGHDMGDKVLKSIAARMENSLKADDLKARMGGDEFVIALSDLSSKDKVITVTKRLVRDLKKPLFVDGKEISISISAGVSFYPEDSKDLEVLIKNADAAMYKAKRENVDIERY
jgi:diguanylate cyclase (GGDEF)-like protein